MSRAPAPGDQAWRRRDVRFAVDGSDGPVAVPNLADAVGGPPRSTVTGVRVARIDHVGIAVPDLEAAIAFHTGVLGGVLAHRERNADQGVEEAMIAFGGGAQRAAARAAARRSRPIARFLDRSGPGLQQLAFGWRTSSPSAPTSAAPVCA